MRKATSIAGLLLLVSGSPVLHAYELGTHREIAGRAGQSSVSSVDQFLKGELGLPDGIRETFPGRIRPVLRSVTDLIGDGAESEDLPALRVLNHFHNPLRPWDQAGLRVGGVQLGQSSVLWQQNPEQNTSTVLIPFPVQVGGENASWQDARERYRLALISATRDERAAAFGEMFETLGHLTHLVQDASVPGHVRNDPHLPLLDSDGYEKHVERLRRAPVNSPRRSLFESFLNRDPVRPPVSIFDQVTPPADARAPVPIARLIDTDIFGEELPEALELPNIGIAEYTNGNFLSDDTIFSGFGLPRRASLGADFFEPEGQGVRRYFEKVRDGETIRHFVAESALYEPVKAELGQPMDEALILTRQVYQDSAAALLPRAVGYSAALLDYFFRGTLDFTVSAGATPPDQTLTITNTSAEAMDGTFTLYADNFSDVRSPVAGASFNLNLGPGATSGTLNFTPPAEVGAYVLVFQGRLGLEEGAVAGKVNDWYAVTNVTPTTIAGGQATTLTVTVKSNFTRQARTLVAALFDGRTGKLAFTSALIPNNGPATTQIALDVTSTTISTDPTISPRPISLVVATAGDIGSITPADLNNQTPTGAMNLVRVGEVSGLPIYQRPLTGRRMFVLSSRGGGISFVTQFDTRPFTVTWKFKNAIDVGVFVQPLNAHGEFLDGKIGELHFSGTQSEFSTFTISFAELGKKSNAMSVLFIEASLNDGFVCILDVVRDGESQLLSGDNHGGFSVRECPE
ncbi:MAG: hypothetical protein ACE5NA_07805 [Nitrospiraceae bacterium]